MFKGIGNCLIIKNYIKISSLSDTTFFNGICEKV